MNVRRLVTGCALAGLGLAAADARAASFECAKAKAPIEKMICSDGGLSDLDGALAVAYRRALDVAPNPEGLKAEQRAWLTGERKSCADVACLKAAYQKRLAALERLAPAGKEATYSFTKAPFINPKIVQDLSTWMSDHGDQVLAINLTDSQTSNRYSCAVKVADAGKGYPFVSFEEPGASAQEPSSEFGYRFVGRTASGIDVLFTSDSGGGSGRFENLVLVRVSEESGAPTMDPPYGKKATMSFKRKRVVIKKVGDIGLGDRWNGTLSVSDDEISIGRDTGKFGDGKSFASVVKVVAPPP